MITAKPARTKSWIGQPGVREADRPVGVGAVDAAGRAGAARGEEWRGFHGEDPSAMAEGGRTDSERRDWRLAGDRGRVQLLQPRSRERAQQSGMGWRRADGHRVLPDYDFAFYFWHGAGERTGID